ncbi:short-chain dehydrogenase/reductase [Candidatus Magnetomorum sp. HK-1]|nr:short-chain dehydrogenase/reductase [Candidatus Magnetomorum sp. HK-1]
MDLRFIGNQVLILGGTCEMAFDLAQQMISLGLFPLLSYRNEQGQQRIYDRLGDSNNKTFNTVHIDFAMPETLESISEKICEKLCYMVDFAQENYESLIAGANDQKVNDYFTHNISFRAAIIKKISRAMLARRSGRMVYVSSTAALRQNPGQGFYAAAKKASEMLYRNIGIELGGRGITTVSLRLGYIPVGRGETYLKSNKNVLPENVLDVRQVTDTILFLLSNSAKGFNATELIMDCGLTACK